MLMSIASMLTGETDESGESFDKDYGIDTLASDNRAQQKTCGLRQDFYRAKHACVDPPPDGAGIA